MALPKNPARIIEILPSQAGQRVDNFLRKHLKNVPKSHIYRLVRSGQVRVNSGRKKPSYSLQPGDKLRIPPVHLQPREEIYIPDRVIQLLQQSIIYQDENLLLVNKPSGIAVHSGSGLKYGVIEAFRQLMSDTPLELVHRLDRETSGCLLLTRNRSTLNAVQQLFQQDSRDKSLKHIEKTYLALVCGQWSQGCITVDAPVSKIKLGGEHRMTTDPGGRFAISHFEPISIFSHYSLMRIKIDTGRMHQIRVHARHCGHPIAGDTKYGDKERNRILRTLGLKHLFLHASEIYLPLARSLRQQAPLPTELEQFLQTLKQQ